MNEIIRDDGPLYGPKLMEAHRLQGARELVAAHDEAERLHAEACAMAQGPTREAALVRSSQALSREANLAREYADLIGRGSLGGREIGESRADYDSARRSYENRRQVEALDDARALVARAERGEA